MTSFSRHALAAAIASAFPAIPVAHAQTASSAPAQRVEITGARERLDAARNSLSPDTGSTLYRFTRQDIANLALGNSTPLNQLLLQSPGVVQDSYGQLHIRGDHANVQYRIDGVVIPEAISGFGQALETRFASQISVLTGALPAQYGYRTAAVVDIRTLDGGGPDAGALGGNVGIMLGTRQHREASLSAGGTAGAFSYQLAGSFLRNDIGIENPTPERNALHDTTRQGKVFGKLSYLIDDRSRVSLLLANTNNRFEIPNLRGEVPSFELAGTPPKPSDQLDASQRERNRFTVLSYQRASEAVDYQISVFNRNTDVAYRPDPVGDLQYNGVAAAILRRNEASGVQADVGWRLNAAHTVRGGLFVQRERFIARNGSSVFPADDDGEPTSNVPLFIQDDTAIKGDLWGAYLQDEWQIGKGLTVNVGLRHDKVDTVVQESQTSPRLGLVMDVSTRLRLHAGYARYFTPPPTEKIDTTSVQRFIGTTNALPSDANTAVKSERSHYLDAGLAFAPTPELTLGIDAYWRKVRHLQDEGQFGNALIFSAFNIEQGRIYGLDLSASYRGRTLSGYVNVGLSHARGKGIETGQFNFDDDELQYIQNNWVHLDHEQALSASAGVSWQLDRGFKVSADALHGSGLRNGFANSTHLPSYTTVNAAVSSALNLGQLGNLGAGLGMLDLRLSVLNVFDRKYQLRDGSGIGVGAPQYGLRRSVYMSVDKAF